MVEVKGQVAWLPCWDDSVGKAERYSCRDKGGAEAMGQTAQIATLGRDKG
jgi:hypothetical protein